MVYRAAGDRPKILELIELHSRHTTAFEASLIERGLRWRDIGGADLTWSDVWAVVENLPYDDPLMRAINGPTWFWYHPAFDYLVGIYDELRVLISVVNRRRNIKSTEVAKPTVRPWDKVKTEQVIKVEPSSLDKLRALIGWD